MEKELPNDTQINVRKYTLYFLLGVYSKRKNAYFMPREKVVGKGSNVINCLVGKITKRNIRNTYKISSYSGRRDK